MTSSLIIIFHTSVSVIVLRQFSCLSIKFGRRWKFENRYDPIEVHVFRFISFSVKFLCVKLGLKEIKTVMISSGDNLSMTHQINSNKNWTQSPINLEAENALAVQLPPLVMSGHWSKDGNARLVNTGSTARITLGSDRFPATIRGGPFGDDVYQLDEVVFRWGSSDCMGAEHTLNGTWFTMEAQAVHWNLRYGSLEKCWDKRDGIAICAHFLQVYQLPAWEEHPQFSKITDSLPGVIQPGISVKIPSNSLCWMRQACQTPGYYTYQGSITTSPYNESVTWIVFPEPVRISEHQAKMFRSLRNKYGSYIRENHRPVQQLNGRLVYYAN